MRAKCGKLGHCFGKTNNPNSDRAGTGAYPGRHNIFIISFGKGSKMERRKNLTILVLVCCMAPLAEALIVNFSLDGVEPAPERIDVMPGQVIGMYVISDSDGVDYMEYISAGMGSPATISNVQSYPDAGDLASVTDLGGYFELVADDSGSNIYAGKHFSFDLTIAPDAMPGDWDYIHLHNAPAPDDTIRYDIVPEPGTIFLLGLGGLALIRSGRK
jgi:hypothetical protein